MTVFPIASATPATLDAALAAARTGRFAFWDAMLLAAAADAGCTVALSEDMEDGAGLGDIVVRNPFGKRGLSAAARDLLGAAEPA